MNILTAIWAFFKNLYNNNTKSGIVLELTKIVFSIVVSYLLYQLMLDYTQIPMRDYRIVVQNMLNINQKSKLCLDFNIDYGGKVVNYFKKDSTYGVSLHVDGDYEVNDTARVDGCGTFHNDNFNWSSVKDMFKLMPKSLELDTVSVIYLISTRQFEIPNPNYKDALFERDTVCEYKNFGKKYDKSKGSIEEFRVCMVGATKMDTDKVNNTYQFTTDAILLLNEGGHTYTFTPPQAMEFSKFDIMSRSDISQSDYHICIRLPKTAAEHKVNIDFGGATEFSDMEPEPDGKTMTGIYYTNRSKINQLSEKGIWFHAKFHQLENIQMIRLFFLTTVLGIMLGLLLSSVWNLIKIVMDSIINR